jgi:hypothetical protein
MADHDDLDGTDVAGSRSSTSLTDLIRVPVRRWRLPLAGAVLGLIAGGLYLLLPATYEAASVVAVRPVVTDPFSYPGPGADRVVNMTVENGLATGSGVVDAVAAATKQSHAAAKTGLIVELPTGSQVLRFRYRAPTPGKAITGANAAANAYLKARGDIYLHQRDTIVKSYDDSIKKLTTSRGLAGKGLPTKGAATDGVPPSVTAQLDRLRALSDQLGQLTQQRAEAAAVDVNPGMITQIAAAPAVSDRDSAAIYAVLIVLVGALAGAVVAYGLEAVNRRVRTGADAAAASRFPVLAELRGRGRRSADLRYLALAALGQLGPVPHRRIVLLALTPADDAPAVARGLAVALAEQGNTVRWEDFTSQAQASRSRMMAVATAADAQPPGDPDETLTLPGPAPLLVEQRKRSAEPTVVTVAGPEPTAVRVGTGKVWLDPPPEPDETMITVVRSGPAERDDRGVRAAQEAAAVVMVRRDRTKVTDLERLAGTLRLSGVRVLGVVVVSGRD